MRLIDVDEAKKQIKQMQTLKASERVLFQLALDRTPTYKPPNGPLTLEELRGIVEQMEQCGYQCEGGPLIMNRAFIRLKEFAYRRKPEEEGMEI